MKQGWARSHGQARARSDQMAPFRMTKICFCENFQTSPYTKSSLLWHELDGTEGMAFLLGLAMMALFAANASAEDTIQQSLLFGAKQPNIIFILTDDQDLHMDSLSYMPHLKRHITNQGTTFNKHYCTVALCCPSRVSLWTGKAAHNTNVTDVNSQYGR